MNKTYDTLYSKDSKGKTRVWFQEQSGANYRTISGLQDGEKVTTAWTMATPKNCGKSNETDAIQQATAEIEAKYRDQESTGYHRDVKDINKETYFSPQLAKQYEDYSDEIDWAAGVYISGKLDGLRCILSRKGMFSRNGKPILAAPHIFNSIKHIFDEMPDLILDSELYCDRLSHDFNKIISLAKKTKPTQADLDESEKYLQLWVFDMPSCKKDFASRIKELQSVLKRIGSRYTRYINHKLVHFHQEVETWLETYLSQGLEGIMINLPEYQYSNKRSQGLLKYKRFQDIEAEILDIIPGQGNRGGMFGYAKLKLDNSKLFDANARGNEELYRYILKNKGQYIGKKATVRFQNYTPDGIPRFPVIVDFDRFD